MWPLIAVALAVYLLTKGAKAAYSLKDGVDVRNLVSQLWERLPQIEHIFEFNAPREYKFVIASGTDGRHSDGSKHYVGQAIDVRVWYRSGTGDRMYLSAGVQQKIKSDLDRVLGANWFVFIESDHIHIQYNG